MPICETKTRINKHCKVLTIIDKYRKPLFFLLPIIALFFKSPNPKFMNQILKIVGAYFLFQLFAGKGYNYVSNNLDIKAGKVSLKLGVLGGGGQKWWEVAQNLLNSVNNIPLSIELIVTNNNPFPLSIFGLNGNIGHNGQQIAQYDLRTALELPTGTTKVFPVRVNLQALSTIETLVSSLKQGFTPTIDIYYNILLSENKRLDGTLRAGLGIVYE